MSQSPLERSLATQIRMAGLPEPKTEFHGVPGRRFRWDFAWPANGVVLEVQGNVWTKGAHSSGRGITRDCEKLNAATLHGWRPLAVTSNMVKDGSALKLIQQVLETFPPF